MIKLSELLEEIDPVSAELGQGLGEVGNTDNPHSPDYLGDVPDDEPDEDLRQKHGKPASKAAQQANAKGLDYMKFGRWGKDGAVTHKTDQSGNLVPIKATPKKSAGSRSITSRNPEGPRSKTPLAQAPKGDYGNPEMSTGTSLPPKGWKPPRDEPSTSSADAADDYDRKDAAGADAVRRYNINRGLEPDDQADDDNYGDEEMRGSGGRTPRHSRAGVDRFIANHANDEEPLPTQTRIPSNNDLQKAAAVHQAIPHTDYKRYLAGHVVGMLKDLQTHNGNAAELAQKYQEIAKRTKMSRPGLWPQVRTDALKAYVNQNRGPEENPEDVPRDASGASHFGADQ